MAVSSWLLFLFLFLFSIIYVDGQCLDDQKKLLLDLKSELIFNSSESSRLVRWNETDDDCCQWRGVECDAAGHVISLDLSGEGISGGIPSTLANLTELVELRLYSNFLSGSLSHLHFEGLTKLSLLDLSYNSLNGAIPHHLFALPLIDTLDLSNNQFSGQIKEFPISNHSNLEWLDLSSNRIEGPVPNSIFELQSLSMLLLSHNLFDGTFELQKIQNLFWVDLSYNNLSVETTNLTSGPIGFTLLRWLYLSSCNLYEFPDLRNFSLLDLDLSNNHIGGDIPSWIWDIGLTSLNLSLNLFTDFQKPYHISEFLFTLDLHSNQLRCEFPLLPQTYRAQNNSAFLFFFSNNSITGVIPTSICIASHQIAVLDFSFNNLSGPIPPCLFEKNSDFQVLNLRGNNIDGVIPNLFSSECGLKTFDVSDNNLGGKVPKSLENCKDLAVMNVGNNNFDDSFPCMLPLSLRILILRSNRFHGDLSCHKSWPNLQILDISSNNFTGTLGPLNLSSWRGMMLQDPAHLRPNRSNSKFLGSGDSYRDEVTLTVKGIEVNLVKIWPDFTSIDLSYNNFEGAMPDAIGNLTSLYLLNLSHNALTSTIPKSLGALAELGSLDLSANHLTGRIPEQLGQLTFLSVLNVSHNQLTGKIPTGPQFQTFSSDSFEGNTGLCGFPLNISCSSPPHASGVIPQKSKDEEIEWEYVFVAVGYVVGLGSIAWTLLWCKRLRERYFEKIEEVVDDIFCKRAGRRRHERKVEKRNEVIRRRHQRG